MKEPHRLYSGERARCCLKQEGGQKGGGSQSPSGIIVFKLNLPAEAGLWGLIMIDRASMVDWIGDFLLCWSEDGILPPDDVA